MKSLLEKVKNFFYSIWVFLKKGFIRFMSDEFVIKTWHIIFLFTIVFLSKHIYNTSIRISMLITDTIPVELRSSEYVVFFVYFTPIIFVSYILSKFFTSISFRVFRYWLLSIGLFVELFMYSGDDPFFTKYIYLYITVDTMLYYINNDRIKKKGAKENVLGEEKIN